MSSSSVDTTVPPPQRYGAPSSGARWLTGALVAGLVLAGSAWLLWATLAARSGTQVSSQLLSFAVTGRHTLDVSVEVDRSAPVRISCRVVAEAADSAVVGDRTFVLPAGDATSVTVKWTIETERPAVNAVLYGCTTADQPQPQ